MKTYSQIKFEVEIKARILTNRDCEKYFGYQPSIMDITQKISHQFRINDEFKIDFKKYRDHLVYKMRDYCAKVYLVHKNRVINSLKSKRVPISPLNLP